MPPIPKQKIKLSMSKPDRPARSNRLGGFQSSDTNKGAVRPKGVVNRPAQMITRRRAGKPMQAMTHGTRTPLDRTNQA